MKEKYSMETTPEENKNPDLYYYAYVCASIHWAWITFLQSLIIKTIKTLVGEGGLEPFYGIRQLLWDVKQIFDQIYWLEMETGVQICWCLV